MQLQALQLRRCNVRVIALNNTYAPDPVPDKNLTKTKEARYPFTVSIIQTNDKKRFFLKLKGLSE
jgi:hypothetical protein